MRTSLGAQLTAVDVGEARLPERLTHLASRRNLQFVDDASGALDACLVLVGRRLVGRPPCRSAKCIPERGRITDLSKELEMNQPKTPICRTLRLPVVPPETVAAGFE